MTSACAETGISATGTDASTAYLLEALLSKVTTSTGNTGVQLFYGASCYQVYVSNVGGILTPNLQVYPITGGTIDGGATDAPFAIPFGQTYMFVTLEGNTNFISQRIE